MNCTGCGKPRLEWRWRLSGSERWLSPLDLSSPRWNRLFRGLVAHRPRTWGEVPGYYYGIHFCGTVQPLSSNRYAGSMRLCGQGSC